MTPSPRPRSPETRQRMADAARARLAVGSHGAITARVWTAHDDEIIRVARWAGVNYEQLADLVEDRTPDAIRKRCDQMKWKVDPNRPSLAERRAAARGAMLKRDCLNCARPFETNSNLLFTCEPCRERGTGYSQGGPTKAAKPARLCCPAGDPVSWGAITAGTLLHGTRYPGSGV